MDRLGCRPAPPLFDAVPSGDHPWSLDHMSLPPCGEWRAVDEKILVEFLDMLIARADATQLPITVTYRIVFQLRFRSPTGATSVCFAVRHGSRPRRCIRVTAIRRKSGAVSDRWKTGWGMGHWNAHPYKETKCLN